MTGPLAALATAGAVFAGTNIDDLLVLTLLFLAARATGRPAAWQIWVGQYLGLGVLVAVSIAAALGFTLVSSGWAGLFGLAPCTLGLLKLAAAWRARRTGATTPDPVATGTASVAALTIANGGDNISAYAPLFHTLGTTATVYTMMVFAVLLAGWIAAGSWLGSRRAAVSAVERFGQWLVPLVYLLIGAAIIVESGVLRNLELYHPKG
ncbi:cadmium resistance transporter [Amycolatopsis acidiphila]|uniref:cadmium resistance transporter n=1 Tax=Amycolatopsis acidiphila TaxID=715473 RepID=UPI001C9805E1|nr:cadmium resistance transporter [Amycolatopsis acidiphila]UIJ62577.1 cadmium resistance transporter [Amycolatopsis acidiphila]